MKKLLLLLFLGVPSLSHAMGETESMRCAHGIVSPGDTKQEVIEKCGEPEHKYAVLNRALKIGYKSYYASEKWLYNFGPTEFIYIALFNNNRISILYSTNEVGTSK